MYRLLIAEDEMLIRKGICGAVDWEKLGFSIAGAVESGVEVLEEMARNPADVLLTDIKMPGMTGLEAIREIRRLYPGTQIVVLSGYADFEYVREALKYQVFDYVLKMDVLTELEPVMRRLRQKMDADCAVRGSAAMKALTERLDASLLSDHAGPSRLVLAESVPERMNILAVPFAEIEPGVCAALLREENMERLDVAVNKFCALAQADVIVGATFFKREEAAQALCELVKARDWLLCHPEKCAPAVRAEEIAYLPGEVGVAVYAQKLAQLAGDAALQEQLAELSAVIGHFIDTEGATVVHARLCVIHALSRWACADAEGVGRLYAAALPELNRALSMRALEQATADFLTRAAQLKPPESQELSVIARAIRYINRNFYKNLKQEAVAGQFYISAPYFSRCFKQEAGMGFTEYIRKLRMEWARHLLEETDMLVQDVARECGYNDIKHFNQTFRGYYGMSASQMRGGEKSKNPPIEG